MKLKVLLHITILSLSIVFSSCGLIWQKQEKELAERLFKEYPTVEGDMPYKPVNRSYYDKQLGHGVKDTVLIVKNGDKCFQIDKEGNRTEVVYYKIRK